MLISPNHRLVISNLGWVDTSALWAYDATRDRVSSIPLGDAKYLSLFPCKDRTQFAVLHHYDGASIRLTVHSFRQPAVPLCSIQRTGERSSLDGDVAALEGAPRCYVACFDPGQARDFYLLCVDTSLRELRAEPLAWYDSSYDKDYQGIVGLIELPSGNLIVSVQRDSHPILYDPIAKRVLKKLSLANRAGNPTLRLTMRRREIWADDYDTILKLDADSLKVKRSRRLQTVSGGVSQFIGRWSFNEDESLCFVPRPFSGDVIVLSTGTLRTKYVATLAKQPLEAISLNDSRVIGRDWQTGQLLKGTLRRTWFA